MSFHVNYDLPGYPRQHERGFTRIEDAEARSNALAEQGLAEGISVSDGEEVVTAPTSIPATSTTIDVEVTVQLPASDSDD